MSKIRKERRKRRKRIEASILRKALDIEAKITSDYAAGRGREGGQGRSGRGQERSRIWRAFVKRRRSRVATTTQPRSFLFFFFSLKNGESGVMEILERRRASVDQSEEEDRYRKGAI
jgi:hypothetical protein